MTMTPPEHLLRRFDRRSRRVLALALMMTGIAPAGAVELTLTFELFVSGVHAADLSLTAEVTESRYRLASDSRTVGLIDAVVAFISRAASEGTIASGEVRPHTHRADNDWHGDRRTVRIDYADPTRLLVAIEPSPAADGRDPVPPEFMRETVDPLSAALDIARHVVSGDRARTLPVFDGRRRYNLHLGPSTAASVEGPVYSGAARRLEITLERIAGFSSRPWLPRSDDPETVTVWFATLADGLPPIPVRLDAVAVIAPVRLHLAGLAVGGRMVLGSPADELSRPDSPEETSVSP